MVKKSLPAVLWDKSAYISLQRIYEYIKQESPLSAEKVREEILTTILRLPENPEKYSPDRFKKNNRGNYRAFEKHSLRVAYKITNKEIKILRIRHVKQEPMNY